MTDEAIAAAIVDRLSPGFVARSSSISAVASGSSDCTSPKSPELLLLLPPGHPQVGRADEIKPKSLAAFAPGCTYRRLVQEWIGRHAGTPSTLTYQEVRSYHAMFACTAAGACFSVIPRSVVDLMRGLAPFEEQPLMVIDTFLASRPGFATPVLSTFRNEIVATNTHVE